MISFKQLRALVAIEQTGSFVEAAEQLALTPSAISQQIRALEEHLGVELFDRSGRSPRLNTDGREACERARQLLEQSVRFGDGLGQSGAGATLAIGATYMVQAGALAPVLAALKAEQPELFLRVFRGMSADLAQRVEQGELDAAIMTGPPFSLAHHCSWHRLDRESFYLVAPSSQQGRSVEALLACSDYIRFDRQAWAGSMIEDELARQGLRLNETMELDTLQAALSMIEHGLGITIMPLNRKLVRELSANFYVQPFAQARLSREVGLYQQRDHNRQLQVEALLAAFIDYYRSI